VITDIHDRAYYRQSKVPAPSWPPEDPAPVVTTRDPRPEMPVPGPVAALEARARQSGWEGLTGYSRSPERAVRVGTYKDTEAWSVHGSGYGRRWSALYTRTVGKPWGWRFTAIWNPIVYGRWTHGLVSDLQQYIELKAAVAPAWFKDIEAREADKAERAREAARNRPKAKKEGSR